MSLVLIAGYAPSPRIAPAVVPNEENYRTFNLIYFNRLIAGEMVSSS